MKRTKEDAAITRQRLIKAALGLFSRKGFAAARLCDIADEAGVTRGAIYHHFGNKEQIYVALFKEGMDPYLNILSEAFGSKGSPVIRIRQMMTMILNRLENNELFHAEEKLINMCRDDMYKMKEIRKAISEIKKEYLDKMIVLVQKGQQMGNIRKDIAAADISMAIAGYIRGIATLMNDPESKRELKGKLNILVDIFIRGIGHSQILQK